MDIVTYAKNTAAVLATLSTLAYSSGYLVLRARAHALGTDPAFTLVDEGYVFAGFRFLFITLVVLLTLAPLVLAIRSATLWFVNRIPAHLVYPAQLLSLCLLALVTIMTLKILSVSGSLLQDSSMGPSSSVLQEAIIGRQPAISLLLTFLTVLLATLSVLWLLRARLSNDNGPFVWVLGVVASIQIFMLPIYHGALFADRKVRVLAASPDAVQGLSAPLGIVDRTSKHFTLLGRDAAGNRRLTTIKLDDLNGIPIKKIVSLNKFMENDLVASADRGAEGADGVQARHGEPESDVSQQANEVKTMVLNESDVNKSFFTMLIDYFNLTFEAFGSLGDSAVDAGQLWSVEIDASGRPSEARRIGSFDNLAWPVVGPDGSTIYALQQGQIVRLGEDGQSTETIKSDARWVKLIGVTEDESVLGFVYEGSETKPAILAKDGDIRVSQSPLSDENQKRKSCLLQEARTYVGDKNLSVRRSERGGRGFDVFLEFGGEVFNLSDGGDDRCGQASLSPDFRKALFVRQPRY